MEAYISKDAELENVSAFCEGITSFDLRETAIWIKGSLCNMRSKCLEYGKFKSHLCDVFRWVTTLLYPWLSLGGTIPLYRKGENKN